MPSLDSDTAWRGVHLFFSGPLYGEHADDIVAQFVTPFARDAIANGSIDKWFFIDTTSMVRMSVFGCTDHGKRSTKR